MTRYELKQHLENGDNLLGTMITVFRNPDIVKMLQVVGFDFAIVDCEHGNFEYGEVAHIIGIARALGFPLIVRIPEARREVILKYMEMGADGLLLPSTETKEQAQLLVKYSKYAPLGDRGVSLTRAHTGYEKVNAREYMDKVNAETILMCQIESKKGVKNIEEIMGVNGIDIAFVGPNDLSQDMGVLGQYKCPEMLDAYDKILAAAKNAGKHAGVHFGKKEFVAFCKKKGYQMNMVGNDVSFLMASARSNLEYLKEDK
jgi:2-keto-3-deoxy-L-rhamnonate aldolase RhmA